MVRADRVVRVVLGSEDSPDPGSVIECIVRYFLRQPERPAEEERIKILDRVLYSSGVYWARTPPHSFTLCQDQFDHLCALMESWIHELGHSQECREGLRVLSRLLRCPEDLLVDMCREWLGVFGPIRTRSGGLVDVGGFLIEA